VSKIYKELKQPNIKKISNQIKTKAKEHNRHTYGQQVY
jgi:hypothetical protein